MCYPRACLTIFRKCLAGACTATPARRQPYCSGFEVTTPSGAASPSLALGQGTVTTFLLSPT